MFTTLPWHLKALIIGFDCVTFLMTQRQGPPNTPEEPDGRGQTASDTLMYRSMLQVSLLYLFVMLTILSPSVFISVKNREKTNNVLAGVLSLMHYFTWLLIAANEGIVSVEHVCYSLQFCFCYASFSVWQEACSDRSLFAGNVYVKNSSFVAMFFFPLIFSKALVNGMHMSPYIIPITFSGEIAGMCSRFSTIFLEKFISLM
jgi:hypothetical protein